MTILPHVAQVFFLLPRPWLDSLPPLDLRPDKVPLGGGPPARNGAAVPPEVPNGLAVI